MLMHGHMFCSGCTENCYSVVLNLLHILLQDGCLCNLFLLGIQRRGIPFFSVFFKKFLILRQPKSPRMSVGSMPISLQCDSPESAAMIRSYFLSFYIFFTKVYINIPPLTINNVFPFCMVYFIPLILYFTFISNCI